MKFFEWTMDYQLYCKQYPKGQRDSYEVFLPKRKHQQERAGIPTHRILAEDTWLKDGQPYYNVHPNLVSKLCRVDMAKIPSTLLKMPHGLRAVNICFAEKHDEFTVHDDQHSDFTAKLSNTSGMAPAGSFVHSVLMIELNTRVAPRSVLFIMDFNVFTPLGQPVYSMFSIMPEEGLSLEECVNKARGPRRTESYIATMENVIRLCVSIGFLADNPTLCEPDVLAKDRVEFAKADDHRREFLADRARRRGKNGYNIGTDIMFLGERPMLTNGKRSNSTDRELEYAHIRSGHPHLVRHGEGKKLVKVMWYVPTTVRPDKPFKSK